jgi:hypothetical protein
MPESTSATVDITVSGTTTSEQLGHILINWFLADGVNKCLGLYHIAYKEAN